MQKTRYYPNLLSLGSLTVLVLALFATPLQAADSSTDKPSPPERTVIFAPTGLGPYQDKDATKSIPREMVDYVKRNDAKFEARLAETLPNGDDAIWKDPDTAKRMSSGAHYAIVTTIDSLESKTNNLLVSKKYKKQSLYAKITVRAINPDVGEVWSKTFTGILNEKRSEPEGDALGKEKQAVQKAYSHCMDALLKWLNSKYDPEAKRFRPDPAPVPPDLPLLDIKITSLPTGGKIYVDDVFRGTTPATVPLSARKWTVKIERQGYQTWVQEVDVSPEMVIQPALDPVVKE